MKAILLAMLAMSPALVAEALAAEAPTAPSVSVTTIEPRPFGYFVGDTFRREVDVVVADPYRLDASSVPAPGRLNYWLDLRAVKLAESSAPGGRHYRLDLDYQTFYVPLEPITVGIPGLTLSVSDGKQGVEAEVPPLSLLMAPLREIAPVKPEGGPVGYLRPDALPRKVSTLNARIGFAAGAAATLIGLVLLAYHKAWWPFGARAQRPFTRAARTIHGLGARGRNPDNYRAGLLDLHRAFDAAAGRRLLAEDVPDFLASHREFQPLKGRYLQVFCQLPPGVFWQ